MAPKAAKGKPTKVVEEVDLLSQVGNFEFNFTFDG